MSCSSFQFRDAPNLRVTLSFFATESNLSLVVACGAIWALAAHARVLNLPRTRTATEYFSFIHLCTHRERQEQSKKSHLIVLMVTTRHLTARRMAEGQLTVRWGIPRDMTAREVCGAQLMARGDGATGEAANYVAAEGRAHSGGNENSGNGRSGESAE